MRFDIFLDKVIVLFSLVIAIQKKGGGKTDHMMFGYKDVSSKIPEKFSK